MWAKKIGERTWAVISLGVWFVPRGLDAAEYRRRRLIAVPADPDAVAVGRLGAEFGVEALVDQRVARGVEGVVNQHGRPVVGKPATHVRSFRWSDMERCRLRVRWQGSAHVCRPPSPHPPFVKPGRAPGLDDACAAP